jgi:hypothetical protein
MSIKISRAEWRWVIVASALVLLLSALPYLVGYLSETADARFGGAIFDRMDYNVQLAGIQTGLRGIWTYPILDTSEPVRPAYVKLFYIFVGQVGRLLPLPAPGLFELTRWVCGAWMLLALYVFAAYFIAPIALRRAAFLLGALGSGVGWLMMMAQWQPQPGVSPIDFWLIDLFGFFSLLTLPHIAAVMALLWTSVLAMLEFWKSQRARWLIATVVAIVLAQVIQPFAPLVVDVTLVGFSVWRALARRLPFPWISLAVVALAQIPLTLYSVSVFYFDPVWKGFSEQNITPSPSPIYYVLGLGLIGLLAVWGAWYCIRRKSTDANVLVVWVIVVAILVYLPLPFQRRFTEGVIAPLAVLAAIGLGYQVLPLLRRWRVSRRARNFALMLIVAATLPSTLYLVFGGALIAALHSPSLFDSGDAVAAVDWLGTHSKWQDTVFSAERTGAIIPALIGHRVYLGHMFETVHHDAKVENVARFFDASTSNAEREQLLKNCGCQFVFWGTAERKLGSFQPDQVSFLTKRFSNSTVSIFQVVEDFK